MFLGKGQNRTTKHDFFLRKKDCKITKRSHAFKGYASPYNVEILNSFNHDIEPAMKNKLNALLSKLKGFKFVTTLVLEF